MRAQAFDGLRRGRDLSDDVVLPGRGAFLARATRSSSRVPAAFWMITLGVADIPDVQSQRTGINSCDPRNAVAFEEFVDRSDRSSMTGRLETRVRRGRDPGCRDSFALSWIP